MNFLRQWARKTRLRYILFALLVFSGLIPLATSTVILTIQNSEILERQEKAYLTRSTEGLSRDLNDYLVSVKRQLKNLGEGFLLAPGAEVLDERLRESWPQEYFANFLVTHRPEFEALRVLKLDGEGLSQGVGDLGEAASAALEVSFDLARSHKKAVYRLVAPEGSNEPMAVVGAPIASMRQPDAETPSPTGSDPILVVQALVRLGLIDELFRREAQGEVAVFIVDRDGHVLWSEGASSQERDLIPSSAIVQDFVRRPLNLTGEYILDLAEGQKRMLGRISPVEATGWGVVVQRPRAKAFDAVQKMVTSALISSLVLVALSLGFGILGARLFSSPIQKLAETSHQIAAGSFGRRLEVPAFGTEIRDLAEDFNRMSGKIEQYVQKLQDAARENRQLFISSIRAFAATIDAKDPYTKGHSERVATDSRTVARHMGLPEEIQERIWISGLLHDVGKIGIEDRILKKGGVLTSEEYDVMKSHTVAGAEIMTPIHQLKEMIPGVRWHHESLDGRGYPDGLKGEAIPLMARIVGVADTFDAITTNRPYQKAYTPDFAVETITKLTGKRFDAKVVTAFLRAFKAGDMKVPKADDDEPETALSEARA